MNRAEYRRALREAEKRKATYNVTRQQIVDIAKEEVSIANKKMLNDQWNEGFSTAVALCLLALSDEFNFASTPNGKGRLDRVIDRITEEHELLDHDSPTQFVFEYRKKQFEKRCAELKEKTGVQIEEG